MPARAVTSRLLRTWAGERSAFQWASTSAATEACASRALAGSFVRSVRTSSRFPRAARRSFGTALRNQ